MRKAQFFAILTANCGVGPVWLAIAADGSVTAGIEVDHTAQVKCTAGCSASLKEKSRIAASVSVTSKLLLNFHGGDDPAGTGVVPACTKLITLSRPWTSASVAVLSVPFNSRTEVRDLKYMPGTRLLPSSLMTKPSGNDQEHFLRSGPFRVRQSLLADFQTEQKLRMKAAVSVVLAKNRFQKALSSRTADTDGDTDNGEASTDTIETTDEDDVAAAAPAVAVSTTA